LADGAVEDVLSGADQCIASGVSKFERIWNLERIDVEPLVGIAFAARQIAIAELIRPHETLRPSVRGIEAEERGEREPARQGVNTSHIPAAEDPVENAILDRELAVRAERQLIIKTEDPAELLLE